MMDELISLEKPMSGLMRGLSVAMEGAIMPLDSSKRETSPRDVLAPVKC